MIIEKMDASYQPALFLHIQKTAGTTMVTLAQQHYGRENVASHGDFIVRHGLFQKGSGRDSELDVTVKNAQDYSNTPFVSGHFGFDYAKPLFNGRFSFTFLRDPMERILSFYYFCKTRDPKQYDIYALAHRLSLDDFLLLGLSDPEVKAFIWNNQTWQLASGVGDSNWRQPPKKLLALATDHLDAFSHIGFAETFEKDRDYVLQSLDIPIPSGRVIVNASPRRPAFNDLPKVTKNLLYELTDLDRQLYDVAWARKNTASRRYIDLVSETSSVSSSVSSVEEKRNYYLGLLQQCLTGVLYGDASFAPFGSREFDPEVRANGLDWPERAQTMVGDKRLANLRQLLSILIAEKTPGDLIETGVWRGGSCILMRAILLAYGAVDRKVWVADSFEGLPPANESLYPADAGSEFHSYVELAVSIDDVKRNFSDYGLLDDQVVFLKGWFEDTLPAAPIDRLALIRLDGDMYQSTMDALQVLYPKLSQNGFVIVDDYHVVPACKQAVHDYCSMIGINPQLFEIDGVGVYWRKTEPDTLPISAFVTEEASIGGLINHLNRALDHLNRVAIRELILSVSKRDANLAKQQMQIVDLSQQTAELGPMMEALVQKIDERDLSIETLNQKIDEGNLSIEALNQKIDERNLSIETLIQQVNKRDSTIQVLIQQVENSEKTIAEICTSSSWKLTRPLRVLGTLIRKAINK